MQKQTKPIVSMADTFDKLDIRVGRVIDVELETSQLRFIRSIAGSRADGQLDHLWISLLCFRDYFDFYNLSGSDAR